MVPAGFMIGGRKSGLNPCSFPLSQRKVLDDHGAFQVCCAEDGTLVFTRQLVMGA